MYGTSLRFSSSAHLSLLIQGRSHWIFLPFMCGLHFFEIYIDLGADKFDILYVLLGSLLEKKN